jgi:hypothetical protein
MKNFDLNRIHKLAGLIKEEKESINNEGLDNLDVSLPTSVDKFLTRLTAQLKTYNLPRKKEVLVIAKIIDGLNMDKQEVMRAIQTIKKSGVVSEGNSMLNESQLSKEEDEVARLYGGSGIKTKYNPIDLEPGADPKIVSMAEKMAPKILAYQQKLKKMANDISKSKEAQILLRTISHRRGYGGSRYTDSYIGDLF